MNRKHLLLGTIVLLLGVVALFTACSLGGDIDAWYAKAYEENYGYPPGTPNPGPESTIPSILDSNASYDQAIDKLDEIIAYCYTNPGNDMVLGDAENMRSYIINMGSSYWPTIQRDVVTSINYLISHLSAASGTIPVMNPDMPYQGHLTDGGEVQHEYRFYVYNGSTYTVFWNDSDTLLDSSYADIVVDIYQEETYYPVVERSDTSPLTFTAPFTGYVIVAIKGNYASSNSSGIGYYEIWYSESGGNSTTEMSENLTYGDTLSAGEIHQYRFYVNSGYSYIVGWRDTAPLADILVGIRQEGASEYIEGGYDTGPIYFTANFTGYVIVEVAGYYSGNSGYYEIWYHQ